MGRRKPPPSGTGYRLDRVGTRMIWVRNPPARFGAMYVTHRNLAVLRAKLSAGIPTIDRWVEECGGHALRQKRMSVQSAMKEQKRPAPPLDFRQQYIASGSRARWDLGVSQETLKRFVDECGGDELRGARQQYLQAKWKRPAPDDFRQRYIERGTNLLKEIGCNHDTLLRWIEECGGEELRVARAQFLAVTTCSKAPSLTPRPPRPRTPAPRTPRIIPIRPADFRERYLATKLDLLSDELGAARTLIERWVDQCGGDDLRAERARLVKARRSWNTSPPIDFRQNYLKYGWDYERWAGCNSKTFRRWIEECGGGELRKARAEHVRKHGPRVRTWIGSYSTSDSAWHKKSQRR